MAVPGKRVADDACKKGEKCDPCQYDNTYEDANGFCIECVEYLCSNCLIHHGKIKATREHLVLKEGDMPLDKRHFEKLREIIMCSKHPDQKILYKCMDHTEFICISCIRSTHNKCTHIKDITELENLSVSADEINTLLSKRITQDLESNIKEVGNAITSLEAQTEIILTKRKSMLKLLEAFETRLERSSLAIQHKAQSEVDDLKQKRNLTINRLSRWKEMENFLHTALKYGSSSQQFILANEANSFFDTEYQRTEYFTPRHLNDPLEPHIDKLMTKMMALLDTESVSTAVAEPEEARNQSNKVQAYEEQSDHLTPLTEVQSEGPTNLKTSEGAASRLCDIYIHVFPLNKEVRKIGCVDIDDHMTFQIKLNERNCIFSKQLIDITTVGMDFVLSYRHSKGCDLLLCSESLELKDSKTLNANAVSLCDFLDNYVAVVLDNKTVQKFCIGKFIEKKPCFYLRYHGRSISRLKNTFDKIAILCSYHRLGHRSGDDPNNVFIEIREPITGKVLKCIGRVLPIALIVEPLNILSLNEESLVLTTLKSIMFVHTKTGLNWDKYIPGITRITSDNEENIYFCREDSDNLEIMSNDGSNRRVIPLATSIEAFMTLYRDRDRSLVVFSRKQKIN